MRILPAKVVYAVSERRHAVQEPELRRVAHLVDPERVAVDVGAWLGPWTRMLARRAQAVHAFEPQPELAARLRRVVPANVSVHQSAVGDAGGTTSLLVDHSPGRDALAHLVRPHEAAAPDEADLSVEIWRLDDVDLGDVGFIKVDVEGHEAAVLRGAAETLDRCRPTLLVEIEQRHLDAPITEVFAWLTDRGWHGWFLRDGTWHPVAAFDVERDQLRWVSRLPCPEYVNNFLFLPHGGAPD